MVSPGSSTRGLPEEQRLILLCLSGIIGPKHKLYCHVDQIGQDVALSSFCDNGP